MAGYSGTPLFKKLGLKFGSRVIFLGQPEKYLDDLGNEVKTLDIVPTLQENLDFIHFFTKSEKELKEEFPKLKKSLKKDGTLWISWPKKTSKVETDLDENKVMQTGLRNGLVDVKVAAIDEIWSGLKFVFRVKDR